MAAAAAWLPLVVKADKNCLFSAKSSIQNAFHGTNTNSASFKKSKHHLLVIPIASASSGTNTGHSSSSSKEKEKEEEEEEFRILTALNTTYNDIVIVENSTSRILLLDSTHNIHSILNLNAVEDHHHDHLWTNSYWDEFATLPAIVPQGPIALLGLGGGTSARLMLHSCPSLNLHGWEIDRILIDKSRQYLGLSDLEKPTQAGGSLIVHVGDALSPSASIPGGFSGIAVDLFSNGKVLPQLQEVTTWLELNNKLMGHGRILVNCGGADIETKEFEDKRSASSDDGLWVHNSTIKALCKAFPGKLSWKKMGGNDGDNYLALTGPFPDLDEWSSNVPEKLSMSVKNWRPCDEMGTC